MKKRFIYYSNKTLTNYSATHTQNLSKTRPVFHLQNVYLRSVSQICLKGQSMLFFPLFFSVDNTLTRKVKLLSFLKSKILFINPASLIRAILYCFSFFSPLKFTNTQKNIQAFSFFTKLGVIDPLHLSLYHLMYYVTEKPECKQLIRAQVAS